jgi:hypothetical protein
MKLADNTTAWLYRFAAWLSQRDESVIIGSEHDCSQVAELVAEFCQENGLPEALWSQEEISS